MAAIRIKTKVVGIDGLAKELLALPRNAAKTVISNAQRDSAKQIQARVLENLHGKRVKRDTGALYDAFKGAALVKLSSRRATFQRYGYPLPTRAALGVKAKGNNYYPTALEYGTQEREQKVRNGKVLAKPHKLGRIDERRFMRDAIDQHLPEITSRLVTKIREGIRRYINRQVAKKFGAVGK